MPGGWAVAPGIEIVAVERFPLSSDWLPYPASHNLAAYEQLVTWTRSGGPPTGAEPGRRHVLSRHVRVPG